MKAGKEHRIPLSPRAVELLKDLYREDGNDFVFIGSQAGSGLSNMAMTTVLRRMGRGDITVHGFRSTLPRLGGGAHQLPQPRGRAGAGAHDQ